MALRTMLFIHATNMEVRVIEDEQNPGFYFAIVAATDQALQRCVSASALSRSPERAAAYALIELGEAMLLSADHDPYDCDETRPG